MIGVIVLLILLLPLIYYSLLSAKKLVLYVLFIGGIPITTFMPNLKILGFMGGLAPQAALLFFIVISLIVILITANIEIIKEIRRFNIYFVFIVYAATSLVWSNAEIYGLRLAIKLLSPILLYLVVASTIKKKGDVKQVEFSLYASATVVLILTGINHSTGGYIGGDVVKHKWIPLGVITAPYMSPANFSFLHPQLQYSLWGVI